MFKVAVPPSKPLMVFDGDCRFCTLWINRWRVMTGDTVEYLPSKDPRVAAQFPELPSHLFDSAVQLIAPTGQIHSGADAVFRSLACHPNHKTGLNLYQRFPAFAALTEFIYRFVARHRTFFSFATRVLWGTNVEPPTHQFVRAAFLRCLGIIYLIAFISLWSQIAGLAGSNGIMPAADLMKAVDTQFTAENRGLDGVRLFPTFGWLGAGDGSLTFQCAAGTLLAVLLIAGVAPLPCLVLLWALYLSLTTLCGVFLGFQWDNLLLETGFLAIFLAPLRWISWRPRQEPPPSRLALWLIRWLLFRLMIQSGLVKLLSGDPTWANLTALTFHFETQPLPTWMGWHAHQSPVWMHRIDTALMFGIELVAPIMILMPRRPRQLACIVFVALQFFILLTGNYGFFNLLAIVLCIALLDDAALQNCIPPRCRPRSPGDSRAPGSRYFPWHRLAVIPLALIVLCSSIVQFAGMFSTQSSWKQSIDFISAPARPIHEWLMPLRSFNNYGLFAVMTTTRPEIVIQGSHDGIEWHDYRFKHKPGDLNRRPGFVAPHMPRLDWQMWFAALGTYRQNPWFVNFCIRLLQGAPEVLSLVEHNPFPERPPKYIRALVYEYRFTDYQTRRKTGEWWRREFKGLYIPPVSYTPQ